MICKKCGAYNPDHAAFCKVCAASLKDQPEAETPEETPEIEATEEVPEEGFRPRRGNVKAPDFSSARKTEAYAPVKAQEPDEADEEEDEDEEEEAPQRKSRFARPVAQKKRRVVDEDDEDEDEDDEDEDEYDEDDTEAEKLEVEPKTTRFARSKKRRPSLEVEDEDEDDEDDDEDDFDDEDDDDEDEYEEYEPTPPRRKKSASRSGEEGGFNIVTVLVACLLVILLLIVGIVAFCNIKGGTTKQRLPQFLQFNCAGKATPDKTVEPQTNANASADPGQQQATEAPAAQVTGTEVDYSATTLEEGLDDKGQPSIKISMTARPGDTVTIVLPNQDDYVIPNEGTTDASYMLTIPKTCYYPEAVLDNEVYTVTPQVLVTHADGTQESLHVDSFDLTFPTIQLALTEPSPDIIPAEGIMAAEGNEILLKGKVDDHTVAVTVNGNPVVNMYEGGNFEYLYTLTGDAPETVLIEASKANYVSASYSFTVTPYVFVPEPMVLTVESDMSKLRASDDKVTVTGKTVPGATLSATPAADFQSSVACGSPTVDAEGNFSFDVTFAKSYYGIASITLHAKKDGYEEGETSCVVSRMYKTKDEALKHYNKTKSYHEVPRGYSFDKVMANPTDPGFYRFVGKILEVDPETGIITFAAKTSTKETVNVYVSNAIANFDATKKINKDFKFYCTLNGLYTDGTSLYITAWFQQPD